MASKIAPLRPEGTFRFVITGNNAEGRSYFVRNELIQIGTMPSDVPPLYQTKPEQLATFLGLGGPDDIQEILPPYPVMPNGLGLHEGEKHGSVTVGCFPLTDQMKSLYFAPDDEIVRTAGPEGFKFGFHRHRTIDYIVVTFGEFWLYLEEGEVDLRAGDVVIQRNTNHSWQPFDYQGPCAFVSAVITCHGL
jgi:hypothetical protein